MKMTDIVTDAHDKLKRFEKDFKWIVICAYGSAFCFFIVAMYHLGRYGFSTDMTFFLLVITIIIVYPSLLIQIAENRRLRLILNLTIKILTYINEEYGDDIGPIPLNGIPMPLGEKK